MDSTDSKSPSKQASAINNFTVQKLPILVSVIETKISWPIANQCFFFPVKIKSAREANLRPFFEFFTDRKVAFTHTFFQLFTDNPKFSRTLWRNFHGCIFCFTGTKSRIFTEGISYFTHYTILATHYTYRVTHYTLHTWMCYTLHT